MQLKIVETEIPAVKCIEVPVFGDQRGYFCETYSQRNWAELGFNESFKQDNLSRSAKGVLRGLHYQLDPHAMGKFVRVVSGAVFDVAVDLRQGSPSFGKWVGRMLSEENALGLWVPGGFAHGFVALEDDTRVHYKCTSCYMPDAERSLLYNDPAIGIEWPIEPSLVSPKDSAAPPLSEADYNFTY